MTGVKRYLIPLLVVVLAGLAVIGLRSTGDVATATAESAEQARYVLRGAQWKNFDASGAVRFEGTAESIDYYDDESALMRRFEVTVLADQGSPWQVSAPEGYAPPGNRNRMQLRGGVMGEGRWPDGEALSFKTPELWVDTTAETLETSARVELQGASRSGSARGLKISGPKQRLSLSKEVEMRYVPR